MFISNHTKKIKFVPKSQSVIDNLKVERAVNAWLYKLIKEVKNTNYFILPYSLTCKCWSPILDSDIIKIQIYLRVSRFELREFSHTTVQLIN